MPRSPGVVPPRSYLVWHLVDADGPNMILMLFGVALLVGVIVGLGARSLTHPDSARPERDETHVSAEALELGYRSDWDFTADGKRAAVALRQVLAAAPGSQRLWENAETGNRGVIWAAPEAGRADGRACRSLERRTLINGSFRMAHATACRSARGVWEDEVAWSGG